MEQGTGQIKYLKIVYLVLHGNLVGDQTGPGSHFSFAPVFTGEGEVACDSTHRGVETTAFRGTAECIERGYIQAKKAHK